MKDFINKIINSDCLSGLKTMPDKSVNCCVTSPPYWGLRNYGVAGQIGLEKTPDEYIGKMVKVFREVKRVLRDDGTLWLNLGDSYCNLNGFARSEKKWQRNGRNNAPANDRDLNILHEAGFKTKDLIGIPWRVAFALQADSWYLRQDIIWNKLNPMPESVTDRCTKAHEYIFMLTKSARYYYDAEAIKEQGISSDTRPSALIRGWELSYDSKERKLRPDKQRGHIRRHVGFNERWDKMNREQQCSGFRNKRDVWTVATKPYKDAHFATFPPDLIRPCILAGTSEKGHCPKCGAIWKRQVERVAGVSKECPKTLSAHLARGGTDIPVGTVGKSGSGRIDGYSKTTGWKATCNCGVESIPDIVLDIFMGAGTTGLVAQNLGRDYIGFELNPAYVEMANKRILGELFI